MSFVTPLASPEGVWHEPLVEPTRDLLDPALAPLVQAIDGVQDRPRFGVAAALMVGVAKTYGVRRWDARGAAAARALETLNYCAFEHATPADVYAWWVEPIGSKGVDRARRAVRRWLRQDAEHARELLSNLPLRGEHGAPAGDLPIPEAPLLFRAAALAGCVVGRVPPELHGRIDTAMAWLGLWWTHSVCGLEPGQWHGALTGVRGGRIPDPSEGPPVHFLHAALDRMPHSEFVERITQSVVTPPADRRPRFEGWVPTALLRPTGSSRDLGESIGPLDQFARQWLPRVDRRIGTLGRSPSPILDTALCTLSSQGGKRARPLMTLLAARAHGATPSAMAAALDAGAMVEWVHQSSLVLDDIVDDANLRHDLPTLHARTTPAFASGVALAVLAAIDDALCGHPVDQQQALRDELIDTSLAMTVGQAREFGNAGRWGLTKKTYFSVIGDKTARLFGCAAAVGGIVAGAPRRQVRRLRRYGHEAGLAFQIADDVLDYFGSEARLGKRPGVDLRTGKVTLPLLLLHEQLPDKEKFLLEAMFGGVPDFEWVYERLVDHHVREACLRIAETHIARANQWTAHLNEPLLGALIARFVERDR